MFSEEGVFLMTSDACMFDGDCLSLHVGWVFFFSHIRHYSNQ